MLQKRKLKELLPLLLRNRYRIGSHQRLRFTGPYASWGEATALAGGYESREILERVRTAVRKVKRGEAAYERDSVVFDKIDYPFAVLAAMLRQASKSGGTLHVLDIGGSLGSTYYQCRSFLATLKQLRWSVVEQAGYVNCGRQEFQDDQLRFYYDISECTRIEERRPDVVLLSGVLQYLRDPYALLRELVRCGFDQIVIDRTPFARVSADVLTIEIVPESIYRASYPMWIFAPDAVVASLGNSYRAISDFPAIDGEMNILGIKTLFKGTIFERIEATHGD